MGREFELTFVDRYVRYVRYTPLALGLSAFWGRAPSVFCFLFSPPAHYP